MSKIACEICSSIPKTLTLKFALPTGTLHTGTTGNR